MLRIGLDTDENGKPTSIAVVETARRKNEGGKQAVHRDIWSLERLSERPDEDAMQRMAAIVDNTARRNQGKAPTVYVNVTGAGKPGLGVLRFNEVRPPMTPVYLLDGDELVRADGLVKMGRGWLVSRLQELLPTGRLRALDAATAGAEVLQRELLVYRPGDVPGSLTIALGLAVQDDWSGILKVIKVPGPGMPNPHRNPVADRMIRETLDRWSW